MQHAIAGAADQIVSMGFANEDVVLGRRIGDQARPGLDRIAMPLRRRMPPVAEQGLDMAVERREAVAHVVGAAGRDLQERGEVARHRIGPHCLRLDHHGIAVAVHAARLPAVDQRDRPAALLQMQRRTHTHHAAAENDCALHRQNSCQAGCCASLGCAVLMVAATTTDSAVIATRKPKAASNDPVPVTMKPMAAGATKPALWPPRLTMPMPDPIWSSRSSFVGSAITEASTKDLKK